MLKLGPYHLLYWSLIWTSPKPTTEIVSKNFKCCGFKQKVQSRTTSIGCISSSMFELSLCKTDTQMCVMGLLESSLNWHISLKYLALQKPNFPKYLF